MSKVDNITILSLDRQEAVRALDSTNDQKRFGEFLAKWQDNSRVIVVLECDDHLEVGIVFGRDEMLLATHVPGEPSIASQLQIGRAEGPPMPDWAPLNGPWCLKQWIPKGVPNPNVAVCLREPDHEGLCRDVNGNSCHTGRHVELPRLSPREAR